MPSEKVLQSKQALVAELTDKLNGAASGDTAATAADLQRLITQLSQIFASKEV